MQHLVYFFQLLVLASSCCPTSSKSLCLNHNDKKVSKDASYQDTTTESLQFGGPWKHITATLTVSILTGHAMIFLLDNLSKFNKRMVYYKTLTERDRT